jgi:prolyl 4-hydroxylase
MRQDFRERGAGVWNRPIAVAQVVEIVEVGGRKGGAESAYRRAWIWSREFDSVCWHWLQRIVNSEMSGQTRASHEAHDLDAAKDWLGRGTQEGLEQGLALVDQAAASGSGEAIAIQAHILALGVRERPDWDRSLVLLARAAELGWTDAEAQLRLLSGGLELPPADLVDRIDIRAFVAPRRSQKVSEGPRVATSPKFMTPAECQWLITGSASRLAPAKVYDRRRDGSHVVQDRSNTCAEYSLLETDLVLVLLRARISHTIGIPSPCFEPLSVLHYSVGQEFTRHVDYLDSEQAGMAAEIATRGQRVATFLVYLNEDYEGGETEFPRLPLRFRGRTGDALMFFNVGPNASPDPRTLHAGLPPRSGEKWLLSQWIRDKPQHR